MKKIIISIIMIIIVVMITSSKCLAKYVIEYNEKAAEVSIKK